MGVRRANGWRKLLNGEAPEAYGADEFLVHRMEVGGALSCSPIAGDFAIPGIPGVVSVFGYHIGSRAIAPRVTFVSTVSHELCTRDDSIVGYVDLILMGTTGPLGDIQRDFLKKVKQTLNV